MRALVTRLAVAGLAMASSSCSATPDKPLVGPDPATEGSAPAMSWNSGSSNSGPRSITSADSVLDSQRLTSSPREAEFGIRPATGLDATAGPECPVSPQQLSVVRFAFVDFSGSTQSGEVVVASTEAQAVLLVFERLFLDRFEMAMATPVIGFGNDDQASMLANNTSGFNCRRVTGSSAWSRHSYGLAIDINPLVNPWVRKGGIEPPEAASYVDRAIEVPGGIYPGDAIIAYFDQIGWLWGGDFEEPDYQHFYLP